MPLPLIDRIVYGPVPSRRLGRSLGVNLLPPASKVCNMNCAYCQYGWTRPDARTRGSAAGWPSVQAVDAALTRRLEEATSENETIDRITIAGHGEPTLHPAFEHVVDRVCDVRDRLAPAIPVAIMSNSLTAGAPRVRKGLARLDERYMKLDAGDPFTCAVVNGASVCAIDLVEALHALPAIVIQAMFVADLGGRVDNTSDIAVNLWLAAIEAIRAERVHVYTLDRPAPVPTLRPVGARRLREIAERVRHAGIPTDVFGVSDAHASWRTE